MTEGQSPFKSGADMNAYQSAANEIFENLKNQNFVQRLWSKDPALWKIEPEHQKIIANSLGWLTVANWVSDRLGELTAFAAEVKRSGFRDVVLLGMGGSSLAPEVFRLSLPQFKKGYPKLHVLDSTDPGWVHSIEKEIALKKTLFVVSSKSGTTIEPLSFYNYFFDRAKRNGDQFAAITDPDSYLESVAKKENFRKIFLNPSDIGGRFSALSYFGMVPAALAGMDVQGLIGHARKMMTACGAQTPVEKNPGVQLGVLLAALAKSGRDKVTLLLPAGLESFGLWIEQLVAESSGKECKGIVPIAGESLGAPEIYGPDRFFVVMGKGDKMFESRIKELDKNHPVARIPFQKPVELGAEFFRWEIATATACSILGIDAFDQPDVQSAKDIAKSLLNELKIKRALPPLPSQIQGKKVSVSLGKKLSHLAGTNGSKPSALFENLKKEIRSGDYIGLLAYLPFNKALDKKLHRLRTVLRDGTKAATLFGYGPRYLHSTGQLHKGGANNGVFILITGDVKKDLDVPGEHFTFGQLETAQAFGDFQTLDAKERRVLRFHLHLPLPQSMNELLKLFE